MELYILISGLLFLYVFLNITKKAKAGRANESSISCVPRSEKLLFMFFWIWLFVLTAFRARNIGNDTSNYVAFFETIGKQGIDAITNLEYGYRVFCRLISFVSKDPHVFLIICAAICYIGIGFYIYKYSKNIAISACLFFALHFSFYMSGIRQGIAMVLTLYAYQHIKDKKWKRAVILILFASSFHLSALIMLSMLFHKYIKINPAVIAVIVASTALFLATGLLNPLLEMLLPKYGSYFDSEYAGSGWLGTAVSLGLHTIYFLVIYFAYKQKKRIYSLPLFSVTMLVLVTAFGFSVNIFSRVADYFSMLQVVEIPNALEKYNARNRKVFSIGLCALLIVYFIVVRIFRPEWNHIYPYEFWN